jgi:hypothetical protein
VVTDDTERSSVPRDLTVVATGCGGAAPQIKVVNSAPAAPGVGSLIQLTAVTVDPDNAPGCDAGQSLSHAWSLRAVPAGSAAALRGASSLASTFVADLSGEFLVRLVVTDSTGRSSAPRDLAIAVSSCGSAVPAVDSLAAQPATPNMGQKVTLIAKVSDADNDPVTCGGAQTFSHAWSLLVRPTGSSAFLSDPTASSPSFVPDKVGTYQVSLLVTDSTGRVSPQKVRDITTTNCGASPPVVVRIVSSRAAPNVFQPVTLSASLSDLDNLPPCELAQTHQLAWALVAAPPGSNATLSAPDEASPLFTPDVVGAYQFSLVVRDSAGLSSAPGFFTLSTSACGTAAPSVNASASPETPVIGSRVTLSSTVVDPDNSGSCNLGQTFTRAWSLVSSPSGSQATLSDPSLASPTFVPDVVGAYQFRLQVTDSTQRSSPPAFVTVVTSTCGTAPPAAILAASAPSPLVGSTVTLTATVTDPDNGALCNLGQTFTHAWAFVSRPAGSQATLSNPTAASPTLVPDAVGTYQIQHTVIDSTQRSSGLAFVNVTTSACGTAAPSVVVAAAPSLIHTGDTVSLSASVTDSNAACGLPQTFRHLWELTSRPAGSQATLSSASVAAPTLVPDSIGTYQAGLVVTDGRGNISPKGTVTFSTSSCGAGVPTATITPSTLSPLTHAAVSLLASATNPDNSACPSRFAAKHAFQWSLLSLPAASKAALAGTQGNATSLLPDVPGAYAVQLVATSSAGIPSAPTAVTITAQTCGANSPSAVADASSVPPRPAFSARQALPSGASLLSTDASPVSLNTLLPVQIAANVVDVDNQAASNGGCGVMPPQGLSVAWTLLSSPARSTARLSSAQSLTPSFTPDLPGEYLLQLVSGDTTGRSATQAFKVTASTCGAGPPVARIGLLSPFPVTAGAAIAAVVPPGGAVHLDGSSSFDPDTQGSCGLPQTLSHRWSFLSLPAGAVVALNQIDVVNPSFTPSTAGTYILGLIVSDGTASSTQATATLTVAPASSLVDRGVGPFTALATEPGGAPVVAYTDPANGSIRVARCTGGCFTGAPTWSALEVDTGVGAHQVPGPDEDPRPLDIKVSPAGQIYVAYHAVAGLAPCAVRVAAFSGAQWNRTTVDQGNGCRADGSGGSDRGRWLSLALTPTGLPALAYHSQEAGRSTTRFAVCTGDCATSSAQWTLGVDVQTSAAGDQQGRWPSLKLTAGGDLRLAYFIDSIGGGIARQLGFASCDGAACTAGNWERGVVDTGGPLAADVGRFASLALTSSGLPRIAYRDATGKDLKFASCSAGCTQGPGAWSRQFVDTGADVGQHASLALDAQGQPRVAYRDAGARALRWAASNGGLFSLSTLDASSDGGMHGSLLLSSTGSPRVSHSDAGGNVQFFFLGP